MPPTPIRWNGQNPDGSPLRWGQPGLTWNGFLPDPPNPNTNTRKTMILHVLLNWASGPDHELETRGGAVLANLYSVDGVAAYPSPPFTAAQLGTALEAFSTAAAAAKNGGALATSVKRDKRAALVTIMRALATYVEGEHGNDMTKLLQSGFEAASTSRVSAPLPTPQIRDILHGANSGSLRVRVNALDNAENYDLRYALVDANGVPGPWQDGEIQSDSQNLMLEGLIPGGLYHVQVRANGGSTGHSDWSPVSSQRCL